MQSGKAFCGAGFFSLILLGAAPAFAQLTDDDIFGTSQGKNSCAATFADAALTARAENYVAGVFIGKNFQADTKAGSSMGRAGVFAELKRYCGANASVSLGEASHATYNKLLAEGR